MITQKVKISSVTSSPTPQRCQKHRSSGNFSTQDVPGGFNKFYWKVSGRNVPNSINFDVMQDKPIGNDPVIYRNLKYGCVTEIKEFRGLYIANPRCSDGKIFTVTVYAE